MFQREYYVYILASRSRNLYVGLTSNIHRRVFQHRTATAGFVFRYRITRLVFLEVFEQVNDAINREKQIKGWLRQRKLDLINKQNPGWLDLMPED